MPDMDALKKAREDLLMAQRDCAWCGAHLGSAEELVEHITAEHTPRKYVVATVCRPRKFAPFLEAVRKIAATERVELLGYVVVEGPGCCNHGVMVSGHNSERFVERLCIALQPGKWGSAPDGDPAVTEGAFEDRLPPKED